MTHTPPDDPRLVEAVVDLLEPIVFGRTRALGMLGNVAFALETAGYAIVPKSALQEMKDIAALYDDETIQQIRDGGKLIKRMEAKVGIGTHVLVPKEPTDAQLKEGADEFFERRFETRRIRAALWIYKAMLAAFTKETEDG